MLFVPTVFNAISFWVTDTFIRHYKPQPCASSTKISHVGSENSDEEGRDLILILICVIIDSQKKMETEGEMNQKSDNKSETDCHLV